MPEVQIQGEQRRIPVIRLDGKDYFIMGGTYQRLPNEKVINEQYTASGHIDRQIQATYAWRFQFTLTVPSSYEQAILREDVSFDVGDLNTLREAADKLPPYDLLEYYDVSANQNFTGTYTHAVYMRTDWETPRGDDTTLWNVPIQLWGYEP